MSTIIYALVARDGNNTPLVEVALADGNFPQMALKLLPKVRHGASMSYTYENKCLSHRYIFHYNNEAGLTFLCMTDAGFATHTAYAFLFDVKERFVSEYGPKVEDTVGLGASAFEGDLRSRMEYFNSDPSADRIRTARANIDKTREIMIENIDKVLARGEKIEILVNKTAYMSEAAVSMRKTATKVKRFMYWKHVKLSLLLFCIVVVIIIIILLVACGVTFSKC